MSDFFQKNINELVAFLFFMVVFVWVIMRHQEVNNLMGGAADVYLKMFNGLTAGARN